MRYEEVKQNKTKPLYIPTQLKGFLLRTVVLEVVLKENPKAKELYTDVKKC